MSDLLTFRTHWALRAVFWFFVVLFPLFGVVAVASGAPWYLGLISAGLGLVVYFSVSGFLHEKVVIDGSQVIVGGRKTEQISLLQLHTVQIDAVGGVGHMVNLIAPPNVVTIGGSGLPIERIMGALAPWLAQAHMDEHTQRWLSRWGIVDPPSGEADRRTDGRGLVGWWRRSHSSNAGERDVQAFILVLSGLFGLSLITTALLGLTDGPLWARALSWIPFVLHLGLTGWFVSRILFHRNGIRTVRGLKGKFVLAGLVAAFYGFIGGSSTNLGDGPWMFVLAAAGLLSAALALFSPTLPASEMTDQVEV